MNNYLLTGLAFCLLAASVGYSQMPSGPITSEKIADGIYIVKGGLANTGFVVGEKEVVAIDAEMTADQAKKMIDEIKKITPKPLTKVILTHSDADHAYGLAGFPQGVEIICSDGAKKEMATDQTLKAYSPAKTFAEKMDLSVPPDRIQMLHFGPAHTSGDAVVFFPARKLAFVGDLVFIGMDPLIHRQKGGNSSGLIKTLGALLALDVDRYIPGHGEIVTKGDIEKLMKSLEEKQDKVKALVQQGKSLDDVKKAFGISDGPAKPGGMRFPSVVEIMYQEFSKTN
jgi:cyclase